MIEPLGPNMARAIVGDSYNSDFRYELETTDEGLQLIVTDKNTGESTCRKLEDTERDPERYDPLYDSERLLAIDEYTKQGRKGAFIAIVMGLMCVAFVTTLIIIIRLGAR